MTVTTVSYPVTPTVAPLKGTLLEAATVTDDFEWLGEGHDLFDTYNCMSFGNAAEFCAPNDKTLDQSAGWISGFRFAAYGGLQCSTVGFDSARAESEVKRVFEQGESTAVERAVMEHLFTADTVLDSEGDPRWDAAVDLTPTGGAVKPSVGVSILEGYAASKYVGVPTLHVPRTIAALGAFSAGLKFVDGTLRTGLGAKVAAGGGYDYPNSNPEGAPAADGERWVYASGEVAVLRGPAEVRQAVDFENNTVYVLAERPYIVAVDCFTAAIRVKVE